MRSLYLAGGYDAELRRDNRAAVGAVLGGAKALLFPIDWPEPFGLVMIEALACGAPGIAYDNGSVGEIIEDGVTGVLVDFFAVEELAQRVIEVLARPDDYRGMREAGRRSVIERYDLAELCLPRWLELIGPRA